MPPICCMKGEKPLESRLALWHHAEDFSIKDLDLGKFQKIGAIKNPHEVPKEIAKSKSNHGLTSTKEIQMNKKLIALAVAGACVAPAAMAQTANPVPLYGRIYATFETVQATGGTGADVPSRNRVADQASLLGVRGTEDLG